MNSPKSGDFIVILEFSYFASKGLKIISNPNSDLAGIVNPLEGDMKITSLSIVIISFFISTGLGRGFSNVTNLLVVSLTRLDKSIASMGSAAVTVKFILKETNYWVLGFLKNIVNLELQTFKA